MPQVTPTGLVLTVANDRAENGYPFSFEFNMMCQQAIMGDEAMTLPELIATRKLRDDEGAAVNAVFSALNGGDLAGVSPASPGQLVRGHHPTPSARLVPLGNRSKGVEEYRFDRPRP